MSIPRERRTAENWCGFFNKQRHASKAAAIAHRAAVINKRGRDHSRTNALKCGPCDGWHIGRR